MVKNKLAKENQKFGEFIIQANKIQAYLSTLVILRSSYADKEYMDYIERIQFGPLIALFCACAKRETGEVVLIPELRKYQEKRNKLAHKIFTAKKLTQEELAEKMGVEGSYICKLERGRKKLKFECPCRSVLNRDEKSKHERTIKHQNFVKLKGDKLC